MCVFAAPPGVTCRLQGLQRVPEVPLCTRGSERASLRPAYLRLAPTFVPPAASAASSFRRQRTLHPDGVVVSSVNAAFTHFVTERPRCKSLLFRWLESRERLRRLREKKPFSLNENWRWYGEVRGLLFFVFLFLKQSILVDRRCRFGFSSYPQIYFSSKNERLTNDRSYSEKNILKYDI